MFDAERAALRTTFVLSRPTVRGTLVVAFLYTAQAAACVLLLTAAYSLTTHYGVTWAIISAILALQPGLHQSVVTSVVRILANTVGATAGLLVGSRVGTGEKSLLLTIAIVVPTCELLRLGLAVRTACVAAVIVLTVGGGTGGHWLGTAAERFVATVAGCGSALVVQLLTDVLRKAAAGRPRFGKPRP